MIDYPERGKLRSAAWSAISGHVDVPDMMGALDAIERAAFKAGAKAVLDGVCGSYDRDSATDAQSAYDDVIAQLDKEAPEDGKATE